MRRFNKNVFYGVQPDTSTVLYQIMRDFVLRGNRVITAPRRPLLQQTMTASRRLVESCSSRSLTLPDTCYVTPDLFSFYFLFPPHFLPIKASILTH